MNKAQKQELEDAVERLLNENSRYREIVEKIAALIRLRARKADGLKTYDAFVSILNERDEQFKQIERYREEMKKVLKLLSDGNTNEAKIQLNIFLHNTKLIP